MAQPLSAVEREREVLFQGPWWQSRASRRALRVVGEQGEREGERQEPGQPVCLLCLNAVLRSPSSSCYTEAMMLLQPPQSESPSSQADQRPG